MTKPRMKLRLVPSIERPLAVLSRAEKLAHAVAWLRSRNRYVLDVGSRRPAWGVPYSVPQESALMKVVMEADRRRR